MSTSDLNPKRFYNTFPDTAKRGDNILDVYVNRAEESANDCVAAITRKIEWEDDGDSGCYLFSGLRGAGKTTELKRLINELETRDISAFYCDADDVLDLNNPDITQTELIFTALVGLCSAVKAEYGADFLQESIWDRLGRVMQSEVTLDKVKVGTKGSGIEFSLQDNSSFKQELIKFAQSSSQFYEEVDSFTRELVSKIQSHSQQDKVVLVVDSLERLSAPSGQEQQLFDSLKSLFFNTPDRLYFPNITVIYTVPPYLHAILPNVDPFYSGTFSLPNFKVIKKPLVGSENGVLHQKNRPGIEKMVEIIQKREANWENYLSRSVVEYLAWLSGGNVRRMFSLIRHVTFKAGLIGKSFPITDTKSEAVTLAVQEETKNLAWLNAADRQWLEHCKNKSGDLAKQIENLEKDLSTIIRLFDHSLILNYQNGNIWYQVPPIIDNYV